ncbi:MAG: hypothetical protein P8M79_12945 [Alphaproteobacteria bacterium]|nr:hypothetical protein [Alphaproteobacteria bacterium]
MTEAVRTDPETGLKVFNTRAASADAEITGSGYAALNDGALKILPAVAAGRGLQRR